MKDMRSKLSLLYKFIVLIVITIGLYINFDFVSFRTGIVYFTLQSNILCFLFYVVLLVCLLTNFISKSDIQNKKRYMLFRGLISSNIVLTMVVYTILAVTNSINVYDAHFVECLFVHYLTPVLVILDYVLFDEKGNMKWYYPFIWAIVPIAYIIFNIIYVKTGGTFVDGKYAYDFLNAEKYGYAGVLLNCILIFIGFIMVNYLVLFVDKKAGEKHEER